MDYVCKHCGKVKGQSSDWLVGLEGLKGSKVSKGAVRFLGKWDEQLAKEPNAIHFCSLACQTRYLAENYGDNTWAA